jgi:RNA polymerase sigma-70 factor (ECF subfamily)
VERQIRFELLYARHAPAVKAYVLRRARSTLADDLVAEVFTVCWRRFDEIPPDPLPWLLGVARRVLSTQRRAERRTSALHERLAQDGSPEPQCPADPAARTLGGALERLAERDRELLLLIAWEGLSPSQAATVLGIRPATARVRLHRARRRLAHALAIQDPEQHGASALAVEART